MGGRILLVEDEPGIQLAIRGLLRREGHQVFVESRGADAMHAVETGAYDLILTDLSLGDGVSGLDIARCAREACPETPVVLITAYGSDAIEGAARDAGVRDYVPKPFDNRIVREVVRRALDGAAP